jgi:anti-anti-sigma factor
MELEAKEMESGVLRVALTGRMDMAGTQEVDTKFAVLTATARGGILVDLSGVTFLASIGIRTLVTSAKAQQRRGGSIVIYQPQPPVEEVLRSASIDSIIPIAHDLEDAQRALSAQAS